MSRRNTGLDRCGVCALHVSVCVCAELPRLQLRTRLCLIVHRFETRRTTNTGTLAARCLDGSAVLAHGDHTRPIEPPAWGKRRGLLLFPAEDAELLTPEHGAGDPVTLFVPDGNWRQASKMGRRISWLAELPRVTLPADKPTTYRLRTETRPGGLATMEAIARAFGILEGEAVRRELERVFDLMVERTLSARGTPSLPPRSAPLS